MDSTDTLIAAAAAQDVYFALTGQQADVSNCGDGGGNVEEHDWLDRSLFNNDFYNDGGENAGGGATIPSQPVMEFSSTSPTPQLSLQPAAPSPTAMKRAWSSLDGAMDMYDTHPHKVAAMTTMPLQRQSMTDHIDSTSTPQNWLAAAAAATLLPPAASSSARLANAHELQPEYVVYQSDTTAAGTDIQSKPSLSPQDAMMMSAASPEGLGSHVSRTPELDASESLLEDEGGDVEANNNKAEEKVVYSPVEEAPSIEVPDLPRAVPVRLWTAGVTNAISRAIIEAGAQSIDWAHVLDKCIEASKLAEKGDADSSKVKNGDAPEMTAESIKMHFETFVKTPMLNVCGKHLSKFIKKPKKPSKRAAPAARNNGRAATVKAEDANEEVPRKLQMTLVSQASPSSLPLPMPLFQPPAVLSSHMELSGSSSSPNAVVEYGSPPPPRHRGRPPRTRSHDPVKIEKRKTVPAGSGPKSKKKAKSSKDFEV